MSVKGGGSPCYFCKKPVGYSRYCFGCKRYVCYHCDVMSPTGIHKIMDHISNNVYKKKEIK